jgi:hypothetical protein
MNIIMAIFMWVVAICLLLFPVRFSQFQIRVALRLGTLSPEQEADYRNLMNDPDELKRRYSRWLALLRLSGFVWIGIGIVALLI